MKLTSRVSIDEPRYERERERSASPRGARNERNRSLSPNGRADRYDTSRYPASASSLTIPSSAPAGGDVRMRTDEDDGAVNTGSNLFVTGIHPRLSESDISRLFEKYGDVENCSIMLDPHTKESRGFGFVKMVTAEQADAAKEGLQGEVIEGRTLSIEKARRARPRTPTPGKYFGPPKRGKFFKISHLLCILMSLDGFGRGPPRGGRFDRYDDRPRQGGYGGRRDDGFRGGRYDSYDRRDRGPRDEYGSRGIDRYGGGGREERYGGRDDRYSSRGGDDRRGGGDFYDRDAARAPPAYGDAPPARERDSGYSGRSYDRGDDRYAQR